jgi:hypothetical protein
LFVNRQYQEIAHLLRSGWKKIDPFTQASFL